MSCNFLTNPTTETSIYQNFYLSKIYPLSSNLNLLRPTTLNCSLMHKSLVFLLSTPIGLGGFLSTIFLSNFNDFLVFLPSFPIGLGGFLSINLFGFFSQYSYQVRRFFIDNFFIYDFGNDRLVFLLIFFIGLEDFFY